MTTLGGIDYLTQPIDVTTKGERVCRNAPDRKGPINGSDLTRREAADYIATLVDELKSIAQAAGLPLIAYLLAMAKEEAQVERARDD